MIKKNNAIICITVIFIIINDGNNSIEDSYKTWGVYKDGKYVYGIVK